MGKTVAVLAIIAAAVFIIFLQTRKPASAEELKVKAIEDSYTATAGRFVGSGGGPGASGLDVTERAVSMIQKLRADLNQLRATLTEPKAIRKAEELQEKIAEFCRKNDIN